MLFSRLLWHIETHLSDDALTLRSAASAMGVTPEYLTRASATVLGLPLMAYVRARRLSRAAEALATGKAQVITAALDSGYGSPEAFSRAFRAQFGLSPSAARQAGLAQITLVPAVEVSMKHSLLFETPVVDVEPLRRVRGLLRRYTMETRHAIPGQWAEYNNTTAEPVPLPSGWFGICRGAGAEGDFDYLCGVDQAEGGTGPDMIELPAGRYARFVTRAHISSMSAAWAEIFAHWMGRPGPTPAKGPLAEFYPPAFDGRTGEGGYEIWIPVE